MTAAPIYYEPTDSPEPRTIPVDRDDMERIAHRHGLTIELDADRAYLTLGGITFVAALPEAVASS